jgi:hypothetical protein
MRVAIAWMWMLMACGPDFAAVQAADDVASYDAWIREQGPTGSSGRHALARLDVLLKEKARLAKDVTAYDRWLELFPAHGDREEIVGERQKLLFDQAEAAGTTAAWQAFLDGCPDAPGDRKAEAALGLAAASYASSLQIGPVEVGPINLARDPAGPKNGFVYSATITNSGAKTIDLLRMNLVFSDASGAPIQFVTTTIAAPPGTERIPPEQQQPMGPGDKRMFFYMTGKKIEGAVAQAVVPARARFAAVAPAPSPADPPTATTP